MLVGVISDTHDDYKAIYKFGEIARRMGVSAVIHAGDWTSPFSMLKMRRALGREIPVYTVFGNNDGDRYNFAKRAADSQVDILGEAGVVELDGVKIGVYHGTSEILVEAMARSGLFDVVIYGHTHKIDIRSVDGVLVVNPGEACGCASERKTAALLNVKKMDVEIIDL
ncbi:metallophosphoesterase [Pyrobaculum aerophilum]|uniref:Phosphoesterase n=1 Tax=Pyrobaculum aerophilum TaxID=13773 RepID=A0A371R0U5_9CREN|nr:metallophosphoesterase [Pyrobaculum aerophilum]RFA96318.1 YfcE family phosphodiesterase [Pyrobaculum aerophilum]RFA96919.1 YfcE family phosphodiesterase [Pyrobaculum aerophilum]